MIAPQQPDKPSGTMVQTVLEPLLDDFQYWFSEAEALLASPKAEALATGEKEALAAQLTAAQKEVATARTLLLATEGQAGVDTAVVMGWHQLVARCWQVARQLRQADSQDASN